MHLYMKPDSPYYWASIRANGKRYRVSTKQSSKKLANAAAVQIERQLLAGDEASVMRKNIPILSEYAVRWQKYVAGCRLTIKSKQYYKSGWLLLKSHPIARTRLDLITTVAAELIPIPGSGSNVNCGLRTLRRMLSMACEENIIAKVPRINLVEEHQRERLVSADEERIILDTSPLTLHDAYLLVFDAGMRPCEVAPLAWQNVDLVRGVILVTRGKTGKKSRRHLPMTQRVREMLIARAKLSDVWVFPSNCKRRAGKPIVNSSISSRFTALKQKMGWPKELVLYSARHTFATDLMNATGNISQTQKALGHTNVSTTTRYLHPETAELGTIMDARNADRHVSGHVANRVQ